jgi:nitronate monooxygenase
MRTDLCDLFGIDVPIFAFSHCRDVVAAVTNAGGLGVLGALAFSPEQLELELKWIDDHVDGKCYGVDTVMPMSYAGKDEGLGKADAKTGKVDAGVFQNLIPEETKKWIEGVLEEYEVPPLPADGGPDDSGSGAGSTGLLGWTDGGGRSHVDVALRHEGVKLLVNALGPPPKDIIDLAHEHGVKVAALTGAVEHAQRQKQAGVDIIIAQGTEAGGHTGTMGMLSFLAGVVARYPDIPVLAAGGIGNGPTLAAALTAGADGAWMGTAFLATPEAVEVHGLHKQLIVESDGSDTVFTRAYDIASGWPWPPGIGERVRRNDFTDQWSEREAELRERRDEFAPDPGVVPFESPPDPATDSVLFGESARFVQAVRPAADIVRSICADAEQILRSRPPSLLS